MSDIYFKMQELLKQNKRFFKNSDANYNYYDLITNAKVDEILAFNLCNLLDKLQFSASEMWIGSYQIKNNRSITLSEVMSFVLVLPDNIEQFSYYSNELTKILIDLYVSLKDKKNKTQLEDHLYYSLSKELFIYRKGHKLVQEYEKYKNN